MPMSEAAALVRDSVIGERRSAATSLALLLSLAISNLKSSTVAVSRRQCLKELTVVCPMKENFTGFARGKESGFAIAWRETAAQAQRTKMSWMCWEATYRCTMIRPHLSSYSPLTRLAHFRARARRVIPSRRKAMRRSTSEPRCLMSRSAWLGCLVFLPLTGTAEALPHRSVVSPQPPLRSAANAAAARRPLPETSNSRQRRRLSGAERIAIPQPFRPERGEYQPGSKLLGSTELHRAFCIH